MAQVTHTSPAPSLIAPSQITTLETRFPLWNAQTCIKSILAHASNSIYGDGGFVEDDWWKETIDYFLAEYTHPETDRREKMSCTDVRTVCAALVEVKIMTGVQIAAYAAHDDLVELFNWAVSMWNITRAEWLILFNNACYLSHDSGRFNIKILQRMYYLRVLPTGWMDHAWFVQSDKVIKFKYNKWTIHPEIYKFPNPDEIRAWILEKAQNAGRAQSAEEYDLMMISSREDWSNLLIVRTPDELSAELEIATTNKLREECSDMIETEKKALGVTWNAAWHTEQYKNEYLSKHRGAYLAHHANLAKLIGDAANAEGRLGAARKRKWDEIGCTVIIDPTM